MTRLALAVVVFCSFGAAARPHLLVVAEPTPPPPPPAIADDAPVVDAPEPAPAPASAPMIRLKDSEPSYLAPGLLTGAGTFATVLGVGMLVWGITELSSTTAGLGPVLGVALGSVFLLTGVVLGAIGVFGLILTLAEKREYRLRRLAEPDRAPLTAGLPAPVVVARF